MQDKTESFIKRAVSADTTREHITRSYIVSMPSHQDLPAVARVSTDGHRMHIAPAPADSPPTVERWIVAPIDGALGAARRTVTASARVDQLRRLCDLADALADRQFHQGRADAITEALEKGRAPKRDELPDRAAGAVIIDGAGQHDDVGLNAGYLRDALVGLKSHYTVQIRCGGAHDPVIVVRAAGELTIIMPMRVDADERGDWPKIPVEDKRAA
jgi:hypothetical protein